MNGNNPLQAESYFDALIVGSGPAGSTCATVLTRAGLRVAVLDRAELPREKLCGGWISPGVWRELELTPAQYPLGLWPWSRCHVQHGDRLRTFAGEGHFIRRYELDEFLLRRSGAQFIRQQVQRIERRAGRWLVDDRFSSPILVGAGGTHCPVARKVFGFERTALVAAKELEFEAGASEIAASRAGRDGEPELFLHPDLGGYAWNVPKGAWLNVGAGTADPHELLAAWSKAREQFSGAGHLPENAAALLASAKSHSYHLFDPAHLAHAATEGALLVGDALGLAHPLTAEGILPAIVSGKLAGAAILEADLFGYPRALAHHPVIRDYALASELLAFGIALRRRLRGSSWALPQSKTLGRFSEAGAARAFAWLFSGRPIPRAGILRRLLREADRLGFARAAHAQSTSREQP